MWIGRFLFFFSFSRLFSRAKKGIHSSDAWFDSRYIKWQWILGFFFFCFVFSQLTGSILQPIPVRLPSNWNLVFEFDMIWPIPTTEDYKRKKKYKKYKRRQWMVKRRHRRELYATFEMALNRYEQVFRVFPASSTFLPRETCLPAKTCREESARWELSARRELC